MKRGVAFSKPLAFIAVAAVAAAGVSFAVHAAISARLTGRRHRAASVEDGISRQIAAKAAFDGRSLEALRSRAGRLRLHLGKDGTWQGVLSLLGGAWVAEPGPAEERSGYVVQPGAFQLSSHSVAAWPGIVEAVTELEAIPGVGVPELEMRANGEADRRQLDVARIVVEVRERRPEPGRAATP